MHDKNEIARHLQLIQETIRNADYSKALELINDAQKRFPNDPAVEYNLVPFLIDTAFGLGRSDLIGEALRRARTHLKQKRFRKLRGAIHYNIGNGHYCLFRLSYDKNRDIGGLIDNEELQLAKESYRSSLKHKSQLRADLSKQLWVNYGNCLDHLGRTLEAFYAYDEALKIDPHFAMAIGNKAKALKFFADISGTYRAATYIKSYQMLQQSLEGSALAAFGGPEAAEDFSLAAQQIESIFRDKAILSTDLRHPPYDVDRFGPFGEYYLDFCSEHNLFLNLHVHEGHCEASIRDSIFLRLPEGWEENITSVQLVGQINQIKEDYVTARLLLVQALFSDQEFDSIGELVFFADTLDGALLGSSTGMLKMAFKGAYDILDKIARFINDYLELGIHGNIYFKKIWREKDESETLTIRPRIKDSKNIALYALYDLHIDLSSIDYQRIREIRDLTTHDYLLVYGSIPEDFEGKHDKHWIGLTTLVEETIRLLQIVRSAVIYLINFVNLEEAKRLARNNSEHDQRESGGP